MKRIMVFIIISCLVFQITGCTKSSQKSDSGKDSAAVSTQQKEQNENQYVDFEELKKNAQLQYPSADKTFTYNVYLDSTFGYDYFVEITGWADESKKDLDMLTIPEKIENYDVVSITGLGHRNIQEVTLPNSLLCLDDFAFNGCKLKKISLPNSIQYIKKNALSYNKLEGTLKLPESLIFVGKQAFLDNELSGITFNEKLLNISEAGFAHSYSHGVLGDDIVLPQSIEQIGEHAFVNNHTKQIIIKSMDVELGSEIINQETVLMGYAGSSVAQYCVENNYTFKVLK